MTPNRLIDYLEHMQQAAMDACAFVQGMAREDFQQDKRTQQAVIMSLIIVGEAATKVMDSHADFAQEHPQVPWRSMRNRMTHGYFDIDLDMVWNTVQNALPELLRQLSALRPPAESADLS